MTPESGYLEIKALWERFMAACPPLDENLKETEEYSPEFYEVTKKLEREHITHIGYLVHYVERLLAAQGVKTE